MLTKDDKDSFKRLEGIKYNAFRIGSTILFSFFKKYRLQIKFAYWPRSL